MLIDRTNDFCVKINERTIFYRQYALIEFRFQVVNSIYLPFDPRCISKKVEMLLF